MDGRAKNLLIIIPEKLLNAKRMDIILFLAAKVKRAAKKIIWRLDPEHQIPECTCMIKRWN